ncbi:MAG: hypothetical protein AAF802_07640 [Planctomycetota bacterium]
MRLLREMGGLYGVVIRDSSDKGTGFFSPIELSRDEVVCLLKPSAILTIRIIRSEKIGVDCFESGAIVLGTNDVADDYAMPVDLKAIANSWLGQDRVD